MKRENYTSKTFENERVEVLMLLSVLGQNPERGQAIKELQRRKVTWTQEQFASAFMQLL